MYIYVLLFIILFFSRIIFAKNERIFIRVNGFILWLLLALRSIKMGLVDTEKVYKPLFELLRNMNFIEITQNRWMSDFLFYFLMKAVQLIFDNYQFCLSILAIPLVLSIMRFIEKKSKRKLLSIIIFISLYYMYATFLLRQVIAISIIILSIEQIEKRNIKLFIVYVMIASLFHRTALIFLIAYPFSLYNKFGYKNYIYIMIAIFIGLLYKQLIINILPSLDFTGKIKLSIDNKLYSMDGNISMFGEIINILFIAYSHYYFIKKTNKEDMMEIYLNIATIGAIVYPLSMIVTEFYRLAMYFSITNVVLIPNSLEEENDKDVKLIWNYIFYIVFIMYFLCRTIYNTNAIPYLFFWD